MFCENEENAEWLLKFAKKVEVELWNLKEAEHKLKAKINKMQSKLAKCYLKAKNSKRLMYKVTKG